MTGLLGVCVLFFWFSRGCFVARLGTGAGRASRNDRIIWFLRLFFVRLLRLGALLAMTGFFFSVCTCCWDLLVVAGAAAGFVEVLLAEEEEFLFL